MLHVLNNLDTLAYLRFNRLQQIPSLNSLFRNVSRTGDGHLYVLLAAIVTLFQFPNHTEFVVVGLVAYAIELPLFTLLKLLIKRDRPFNKINGSCFSVQPNDRFSMPSGHTAAAFLMATLIVSFYNQFAVVACFWATMIGISRIALGVHYPSDVLAGALLGSSCTVLALALVI